MKFNKNNYDKAEEMLFFCVSEEYDELSYSEFRAQLKKDRDSGLLEECGFKVDLRKNEIIDISGEEE